MPRLDVVLACRSDYGSFSAAEQEALDAITVKMARILYGKPVRDNLVDIAGYSTLALETYHE